MIAFIHNKIFQVFYLFILGCAGFSLVVVSRVYSLPSVPTTQCGGFPYCGAQALVCAGFRRHSSQAPESRLSNRSARA